MTAISSVAIPAAEKCPHDFVAAALRRHLLFFHHEPLIVFLKDAFLVAI